MSEKKNDISDDVLQITLKNIDKKFGKGAVQLFANFKLDEDIEVFSTRSLSLDNALGIGGIPRGRITEIFGSVSSGKTTMALNIIAAAQKSGNKAVFVDAEHALDVKWAKHLGVDLNKTYISQPDSAEEALGIVEEVVRSNGVGVVVVDSVSALVPQAELDGSMEDQQIGLQARLMGKGLRKVTGAVSTSNTALIFLNQTRSNINAYMGGGDVTPGGNALKFFSSIRIELKKIKQVKSGVHATGDIIRARIVKNKLASPFKICEILLSYGVGFDIIDEIINELMRIGTISKDGAWFKMDGKTIGQGKSSVADYIKNTDGEFDRLLELAKRSVVLDADGYDADECQ